MMRQVQLLPAVYAERRKQRRVMAAIVTGGVVLFTMLVGWWFMLGTQIGAAEDELAQVEANNRQLTAQIGELQRFAQLEQEVTAKKQALLTVMQGDVDWPAVMTELAMVVPGEVWLTEFTGSAGTAEGSQPVGTETAPVRISEKTPFGRIQFKGRALTMPGVAKWLVRLATIKEFGAIWLNDATEVEEESVFVYEFDNTIELDNAAASKRYTEELR